MDQRSHRLLMFWYTCAHRISYSYIVLLAVAGAMAGGPDACLFKIDSPVMAIDDLRRLRLADRIPVSVERVSHFDREVRRDTEADNRLIIWGSTIHTGGV